MLRALLTADVVWQGVRKDWACHGPAEVVETLLGAFEHIRPVDGLEFISAGITSTGPTSWLLETLIDSRA